MSARIELLRKSAMQLMNLFKLKLLRSLVLIVLPVVIAACAKHSQSTEIQSTASVPGCEGNVFLQKYGCNIDRVTQGAESGDPDAQYALGYMYYYGIGTVRDKKTAALWINKAATEGQPLAIRAQRLLSQGRHLHELHSTPGGEPYIAGNAANRAKANEPVDVNALNHAAPTKPLNQLLPAYGKTKTQSATEMDQGSDTNMPKQNGTREPYSMQKSTPKVAITDPRLQKYSSPITPHSVARAGIASVAASEKALMHVRSNYYTLQLMGSHDLKAVQAFIKSHHLQNSVKVYSTKYDHQDWYMLVYGRYKSLNQAQSASERLPRTLRKLHPWAKSFRVVHKEIQERKIIS